MTSTAASPTSSPASAPAPAPSTAILWLGRVLSALPVLMLLMSGGMKLSHAPQLVENFTKFGYAEGLLTPLGIVEITCALLYAFPRTAVLGAILVTGYLGGAVATHVRAGESFLIPLVLGVVIWAGLYLRDARVKGLIPLN